MRRKQILPAGTIKRLHVNRQKLAQNVRDKTQRRPALTVQTSRGPVPCKRVVFRVNGKPVLVFDQRAKQLACGARIYGETRLEMEID